MTHDQAKRYIEIPVPEIVDSDVFQTHATVFGVFLAVVALVAFLVYHPMVALYGLLAIAIGLCLFVCYAITFIMVVEVFFNGKAIRWWPKGKYTSKMDPKDLSED